MALEREIRSFKICTEETLLVKELVIVKPNHGANTVEVISVKIWVTHANRAVKKETFSRKFHALM